VPRLRGHRPPDERALLNVKIPPGIHDGQTIRIRGEGEPGASGGSRGDLRCMVRGAALRSFSSATGDHLVCVLPISFTQAALGGQVDVPTLTGSSPLRIPPGTSTGLFFDCPPRACRICRVGGRATRWSRWRSKFRVSSAGSRRNCCGSFAATEDKQVLPETKGFFEPR